MQKNGSGLLKRVRLKRICMHALWRIGVCLGLAGAAIVAVRVIGRMTETREPFVDAIQSSAGQATHTSSPAEIRGRLRFAVATMVSAEETFSTYRQFVHRISKDIGKEEAFILRPSYEDVRLALMRGEVDVAFVCMGTYLSGLESRSIKLLVQPEFDYGREYRSLLLVPSDSRVQTWEDLRDKTIAFTDHESFTGYLLPSAMLAEHGHDPDRYFKKIIYTGSHDRSIMAVSTNIIDAAAVMSLVWQSTLEKQPSLAKRVRVVWQSQVFGPPAIVTPKGLNSSLEEALRKALLSLHEDEEGRGILRGIGIKRFVPAQPESYDTAVHVYRRYRDWLSKR